MSYLKVFGGRKLKGEYTVHGAKNSVLPLLAATVLIDGEAILHNCPELSDVAASIDILKCLGCRCDVEGPTVTVDTRGFNCDCVPECLMREMRSSIVFMGAVAAKCGRAEMGLPGGCELGPRPIDLHIDALKRLGATVTCEAGKIICEMPNGAVGCDIHLKFPSVGATENIIFASALGNGTTVIRNAAREPEIVDLADFLNKAGADILGAGTDTVIINGVKALHSCEHSVMPDRIVAATVLYAVAACRGRVKLNNIVYEHLIPIVTQLKDCGCDITFKNNALYVSVDGRIKSFDTVTTQPFPGFPTDAGPLAVASATVSKGMGIFVENIFDRRFHYVDELKRLGADIKTFGRVAMINGVKHLNSANVNAGDLRGGAALTIGALAAEGESKIYGLQFIDRGYQRIEEIFGSLNAELIRYGS